MLLPFLLWIYIYYYQAALAQSWSLPDLTDLLSVHTWLSLMLPVPRDPLSLLPPAIRGAFGTAHNSPGTPTWILSSLAWMGSGSCQPLRHPLESLSIPWWPCIRLRDVENYKSSPEFLHTSYCQQGLTSVLDRKAFQLCWTKECSRLRVSGMMANHFPSSQAFCTQPELRMPHSYLILLHKATPLFFLTLAIVQWWPHEMKLKELSFNGI